MAQKDAAIDSVLGLVCVEFKGKYGGFKQDLVLRNLTNIENRFLTCPKCKGITREAVVMEGQTMCTRCTRKTIALPVHRDVRESVDELEVRCPLNKRGCEWRGQMKELEAHVTECEHLVIACSLMCGSVMERYNMSDHQAHICGMRLTACDYCGDKFLAKKMNMHIDACPSLPILCPQQCGQKSLRSIMQYHLDEVCELSRVVCPFNTVGCQQASLLRNVLKKHEEENVIYHQECLCQQAGKQIKQSVIEKEILETKLSDFETKNEQLYQKMRTQDKRIEVQNKEILELQTLVKKQCENIQELQRNQVVISNVLLSNFPVLNPTLKIQLGQELDELDLKKINKFDWEIKEISEKNKTYKCYDGPKFNLGNYRLSCRANFGNDFLVLSIRREHGNYDHTLPDLRICFYYIQLINKKNEMDSIVNKAKKYFTISKENYEDLAVFKGFLDCPDFLQNNSVVIRICSW